MKKCILILAVFVLGTMASYSQMVYDFKKGELVEAAEYGKDSKMKAEMSKMLYAGEIHLKSGKVIEGNFGIVNQYSSSESFVIKAKHIKVKCFPDGRKEKLNPEDIEVIRVYSTGNTGAYTLIYNSFVQDKENLRKGNVEKRAGRNHNELEFKDGKRSLWMMQLEKGKANLYVIGTGFQFSNGVLIPYVMGGNSTPPFLYLGQVEERDELPMVIHMGGAGGNENYFLGVAPAFFEGHPISEKIRNRVDGYDFAENGNLKRLFEMYNENDKP